MNKYQETYQRLTNHIYKYDHIEDVYKDLEVLGELVDKATQRKRIYLMEDISKCPSCNSFVTSVDRYCPNCGQRLDRAEKTKKIELSEEEKNILKIYITPYKDQIIAITRCTDYLREYLYIIYNDGSNKYVWLPNTHCFNNAKLCKYYPLREFLERIEYERSEDE